jgi:hypothetical protein
VTKQNKDLKRQSNMLMQHMGKHNIAITEINIDEIDSGPANNDDSQQEYLNSLNDRIKSR